MYTYEYFDRQTLGEATKHMLDNLERKIARCQKELIYLRSEEFKKLKRRYRKWTQVYIKLARSGKFTPDRLDHLDDRICDLLETIRDHLAEDGWYIGAIQSVELPDV